MAEFRRAALPLALPLERLAEQRVPGVTARSAPYFRDVHDHLLRATDAIETFDRLLTDVLQANLARVGVRQNATAVRQNEDMRRISAWAAIALVPTAIASCVLFALSGGLLWYVVSFDARLRQWGPRD